MTRKFLLHSTLVAALLAACVRPAAAQTRTYNVFTADVPFKFNIGNRTFRPGHYQFIFVGAGLLALRDAKKHVVASVIYRPINTGAPSPVSKLVFKAQKKHAQQLARICIQNQSQVLEILEEELAIRQTAPPPPALLPQGIESMFERSSVPRLRQ